MPSNSSELYEFEDFRLDAARRLLSRGGEPLRLNSKALETLLVLVRNRARILTKDIAVRPTLLLESVLNHAGEPLAHRAEERAASLKYFA